MSKSDSRAIDKYLKKVTKIVYDSKKRSEISQELSDMIDDFTEAYMEMGMSEEEARREAVKQMGDPEETGKLFNQIYRVKYDWKLLAYMFVWAIAIRVLFNVFSDYNELPDVIYYFMSAVLLVIGIVQSVVEKWMDFPFFYAYGNNWKGFMLGNSGMLCGVGIGLIPFAPPEWFLSYSIVALFMMVQRSYMVEKRNKKEQKYLWEIATALESFDYRGKVNLAGRQVKVQIKRGSKAEKGEPLIVVGLTGYTLLVDVM